MLAPVAKLTDPGLFESRSSCSLVRSEQGSAAGAFDPMRPSGIREVLERPGKPSMSRQGTILALDIPPRTPGTSPSTDLPSHPRHESRCTRTSQTAITRLDPLQDLTSGILSSACSRDRRITPSTRCRLCEGIRQPMKLRVLRPRCDVMRGVSPERCGEKSVCGHRGPATAPTLSATDSKI